MAYLFNTPAEQQDMLAAIGVTSIDDLFATICGKPAVSDRLWRGFGHIEAATNLIDENDLGFAFPVEGMLMRHYRAEPIPAWWEKVTEHYTQAMIELYRSHDATHPRGRRTLFYYAKRSEYVLEYLGCVKALREASTVAHSHKILGSYPRAGSVNRGGGVD